MKQMEIFVISDLFTEGLGDINMWDIGVISFYRGNADLRSLGGIASIFY